MLKPRNIAFTTLLGLSMLTFAIYQNCSGGVTFSKDSNQDQSLSSVAQSCVDPSQVTHQDGDQWSTSGTSISVISCPDSSSLNQNYKTTITYECQNGTIATVSDETVPVGTQLNCPAPALSVAVDNATPQTGATVNLQTSAAAVHDLNYACSGVGSKKVLYTGALKLGSVTTPLTSVAEDLSCAVNALGTINGSVTEIIKTVDVSISCESSGQLKDPTTHSCVAFSCQSFVTLAPQADGSYQVPARTSAGLCYSVHLLDAVAFNLSSLTTTFDNTITSANHDPNGGLQPTRHPYLLGSKQVKFTMAPGFARQILLSSSKQAAQSIKVDNFLVVGLSSNPLSTFNIANYHAYGTADSAVPPVNDAKILMNDKPMPLQSFGSEGTSTIGALDITTKLSTGIPFYLDVRALDCGGDRELSNIELIFQ